MGDKSTTLGQDISSTRFACANLEDSGKVIGGSSAVRMHIVSSTGPYAR